MKRTNIRTYNKGYNRTVNFHTSQNQRSARILSCKKTKSISKARSGILLIILVGWAFITMMRCAPQTKTVSLPFEPPQAFSDSGTTKAPQKWWTAFGDEQLNTMVDSALTSNFSLKTAWQRLQAARAVVDRESASLLPDIEGSMRGSMDRPKPDFVGGESIRFGLRSVYEVDLWGRIRSRVQAERYREDASMEDYQAAALSLAAEIVRTRYQLVEARSQLTLINDQIETNEQVLELLESRFGTGQIRGVDILRQRQLVKATREQQIQAESRHQVLEHQLAVLLGRPPQENVDTTAGSMPQLPPLPETGIPVDLVRRRPDVKSAFHQLQAADRDVAAAISNQYPRLSLSASASLRANSVDNLFENWAYSLGGNLLAPIFYGGELSAEVDRNVAVKQQRLYEYGQTVLVAFREVEDALMQEQYQAERIQNIEEQVDLAQKVYEQLRVSYFNGASNYLDVLTALDELQQLHRDLLSAKLILLEYRIALYRALAGGFETARSSEMEE